MTKYRKIEGARFERDWRPVYDRVFKKNIGVGYDESPFVDPSWRSVPMPLNPFWTDDTPGLARPDDYPPIEPYFPDYYQPLFLTLAEFGIDQMVTGVANDGWFEISATREGVDEETPPSANYRMYEFYSAEGNWGLICDWEDVAMLGGTPEFMEAFYRIGGGERAVQARFLYFLLAQGAGYPQGIAFTPKYYLTRWPLIYMYQQAGWPFPNRWVCYAEEEIDWSWMMDDEGFPEK